MRARLALSVAALAMLAPAVPSAHADPEGCVTTNPGGGGQVVGNPTCEFTASREGSMGCSGNWKVTVTTPAPPPKKGKKKAKDTVKEHTGNSPVPTINMAAPYKAGDKIKVESLSPGTVCAVGEPTG